MLNMMKNIYLNFLIDAKGKIYVIPTGLFIYECCFSINILSLWDLKGEREFYFYKYSTPEQGNLKRLHNDNIFEEGIKPHYKPK